MPLPAPPTNLLKDSVLFLDFDGTLVPIAERPDAITVDPDLLPLLERLCDKLEGRLVLVSGRATADVRRWLGSDRLRVVGSHGLERDGVEIRRSAALDECMPFLHEVETQHAGVIVEEKPFGAAIHFRNAPEAETACRVAALHVAASADMRVLPGKMVFEIKPANGNKGTAIVAMMTEPELAKRRALFLGDDITDEFGFVAVRGLGGAGILVGDERETAATYRLGGVDQVHRWLAEACEELP
ncbi:trehalose-phosphatase [Sphingomonas glaciei]|uniref:Trehalose 6-phosphate phosphatase n=1 Tax=Sphingomonas glaciei TaxID=2938948 RepID=A0ABY5MZT5_9SPHN|nr:trehalose-phosphatase [Sphingomonas glaciei]UUR09311.1 trehalose-phosphatase [Sphingomonas glaciei]